MSDKEQSLESEYLDNEMLLRKIESLQAENQQLREAFKELQAEYADLAKMAGEIEKGDGFRIVYQGVADRIQTRFTTASGEGDQ